MLSPTWLGDVLAAVVLATAAYCFGRLLTAALGTRRVEYDADVTHVLMGVGMAGMFASRLSILNTSVWEAVFGVVAAWFAVRTVRESLTAADRWCGLRHHGGHLLSAGAMLYMFAAVPAASAAGSAGGMDMSGGMGASGGGMGASFPTLALLFALLLFGYAVLVTDRIPLSAGGVAVLAGTGGAGTGTPGARGPLLAPRASALCEIVMSVAMGIMLIAML